MGSRLVKRVPGSNSKVVGGVSLTLTSNSLMPAGCLRIQLNSDSLSGGSITFHRLSVQPYKPPPQHMLQTAVASPASDRHGIDWRFQWSPPTQNASCKSRLLSVHNLEVPTNPSLVNLLEWLTELRGTCYMDVFWFLSLEACGGRNAMSCLPGLLWRPHYVVTID